MMKLPLLLLAGLLALAGACSGGAKEPASTREREGQPYAVAPTTTVRPIDIASFDFRELIYWDSLLFSRPPAAPVHYEELVKRLARHEDPRYRAFLIDLGFYPTPYRDAILPLLLEGRSSPGSEASLEIVERAGFKGPNDDLPQYLPFKKRFLETIDPGVAAFLDPTQPRTISAQEIFWGGVCVDCIPPLNEPRFLRPSEAAKWINASDEVIAFEINGDARAYPRRIIDWHEMVNDTVGGVPVSLAYCTLCGSAILYDGRHGDEVFRFGTSGLLYRSNKLMYDRNTRSLWEQYTGEPAWGPLVGRGIELETLPVVHTTWEEWLRLHPDTRVLDIDTGHRRDYGPGVAYARYWASGDLIFPAPGREGPLKRKDWVYAVRLDREVVAYPILTVAKRGLVHDQIGSQPVVVIATADGSGARAYDSGGLRFSDLDRSRTSLRSNDGRRWQVTEAALAAPDGARLERLPGHNSFWFAVINHAPSWRLYEEP